MGDRVHFLGHVRHYDLVHYYRAAGLFVFPSRLETFGHPLVEAMATGTPVIASDLPVCREICKDGALYFEPDDVTLLSEQIRTVLEEPGLRHALKRRGIERSGAFSWDTAAQQMIDIFEQAAA